jgi:hypothetical protein
MPYQPRQTAWVARFPLSKGTESPLHLFGVIGACVNSTDFQPLGNGGNPNPERCSGLVWTWALGPPLSDATFEIHKRWISGARAAKVFQNFLNRYSLLFIHH